MYNSSQCRQQVWRGIYRTRQCLRKPVKDGYCQQHHPDAKNRRDEKRDSKYRVASANRVVQWMGPNFLELLERIAAGKAGKQAAARMVQKYKREFQRKLKGNT